MVSFLLSVIALLPSVSAGFYGINISTTNFPCGASDSICPPDYAGCQACITDTALGTSADDPDCCAANSCGWGCTAAGVVCGDSSNEIWKDETDSQGDTVSDSDVEDCSGNCTSGTEHVIDDSNDAACIDTYYNSNSSCADDGILFAPYSTTCEEGVTCKDTDADSDAEICDGGNWHDADESETYCTAASGMWEVGIGTDSFADDYNNDLSDGYCDGDDGYSITGAILAETYRGSSECEAAEGVTVTVKDASDTTKIIESETTVYSASWSYETFTCQSGNEVGEYSLKLPAGTYYLVAEKSGYNTVTKTITITEDAVLSSFWLYFNAECQADCTKNDRLCYAACDGVNGCNYSTYEEVSIATYCDGLKKGYRYVLSEETDAVSNSIYGYEVHCCNKTPEFYTREYFTAADAAINCVENIISRSKMFWVNGELLTLNFVVFSDPMPEKTGCSQYSDFLCETYGGGFCT